MKSMHAVTKRSCPTKSCTHTTQSSMRRATVHFLSVHEQDIARNDVCQQLPQGDISRQAMTKRHWQNLRDHTLAKTNISNDRTSALCVSSVRWHSTNGRSGASCIMTSPPTESEQREEIGRCSNRKLALFSLHEIGALDLAMHRGNDGLCVAALLRQRDCFKLQIACCDFLLHLLRALRLGHIVEQSVLMFRLEQLSRTRCAHQRPCCTKPA